VRRLSCFQKPCDFSKRNISICSRVAIIPENYCYCYATISGAASRFAGIPIHQNFHQNFYMYILYTYIHTYTCTYVHTCVRANNILYLRHKVSYQCIARVWTTRSFLVRETLQATLDLFGASVTWISDGKVSLRLRLALRQRHRRSAYRVQGRNVAVDLAAKRPR